MSYGQRSFPDVPRATHVRVIVEYTGSTLTGDRFGVIVTAFAVMEPKHGEEVIWPR